QHHAQDIHGSPLRCHGYQLRIDGPHLGLRSKLQPWKEPTMSGSSTPPSIIAQIVTTMRTLAGPHPGFRPVHAKGIVCTGRFQASPEAHRVSRAPHLQDQSVPAIIRFSNSAGDPAVHDGL